jgi:hypothetical protein
LGLSFLFLRVRSIETRASANHSRNYDDKPQAAHLLLSGSLEWKKAGWLPGLPKCHPSRINPCSWLSSQSDSYRTQPCTIPSETNHILVIHALNLILPFVMTSAMTYDTFSSTLLRQGRPKARTDHKHDVSRSRVEATALHPHV